jgi:hypothetical protein
MTLRHCASAPPTMAQYSGDVCRRSRLGRRPMRGRKRRAIDCADARAKRSSPPHENSSVRSGPRAEPRRRRAGAERGELAHVRGRTAGPPPRHPSAPRSRGAQRPRQEPEGRPRNDQQSPWRSLTRPPHPQRCASHRRGMFQPKQASRLPATHYLPQATLVHRRPSGINACARLLHRAWVRSSRSG